MTFAGEIQQVIMAALVAARTREAFGEIAASHELVDHFRHHPAQDERAELNKQLERAAEPVTDGDTHESILRMDQYNHTTTTLTIKSGPSWSRCHPRVCIRTNTLAFIGQIAHGGLIKERFIKRLPVWWNSHPTNLHVAVATRLG